MPSRENANPYDEPGLLEAFRRGWKVLLKSEPRQIDLLIIQARDTEHA